jgi:hypothetical protein
VGVIIPQRPVEQLGNRLGRYTNVYEGRMGRGCSTGSAEGSVGTIPRSRLFLSLDKRSRRPPTVSSFSPLALAALLECAYLLFD